VTEMPPSTWADRNARHVQAAAAALRTLVERSLGQANDQNGKPASDPAALDAYRRAVDASEESAPVPSAVGLLCRNLRFSEIERDVLLLCAAVEVDPQLASQCAAAEGRPTLAFALNLFAPGSWTAVSPSGPLIRYRIVTPAASGDSCRADRANREWSVPKSRRRTWNGQRSGPRH